MKQRNAYSYIRMSTSIQLKGDSLRRQLQLSESYASSNGLELINKLDGIPLSDIGISAFKGDNSRIGTLGLFISALQAGKIPENSVLLVESLDRLSRDKISGALSQFMHILELGIEIVTLNDNLSYTLASINGEPTKLFLTIITMIRANEESEIKSKRLSAAWMNKRNNVKNKIITRICPAWLKYDEEIEKFIIVPDRGRVVKQIFDMCINTCGIYSIARHLNQNNVPQFGSGRIWYVSYVKKIIENRAVLGELSPHNYIEGVRQKTGDTINDYYPKVIDEHTFYLAQLAITNRSISGKGRKGTNFTNLFSGLIYCGLCNFTVMVKTHNSASKSGKYLICTNKNVSAGCHLPSWNLSEFEGMIFKHLREINFADLMDTSSNDKKVSLNDEMNALILNKANKEDELGRVINFSTENDLNESVKKRYVTRANLLDAEIESIDGEIKNYKKLIEEQSATEKLFNTEDIKNLISKIEQHQHDYLFRSSLNQFLNKLILKIELFYDKEHIKPWEFDTNFDQNDINETDPEYGSVFIAFRSTFKIRARLSMAEIIGHPDFELFNKNYNRFIRITYKTGIVRELFAGSDSSFVHKPFNASNKKLS